MALPIDLLSPLSLVDCAARLDAITEPERWFPKADGDRPLTGRLKGSRLRLRKFGIGHNSWQICLFATVMAEAGGTRLRGWIGIHPHIFFVGVAVAILTLGRSLTLLTTAFWDGEALDWPRMVAPLVPLLVFSGLGFSCWRPLRGDARWMRTLLIETLAAKDATGLSGEVPRAKSSGTANPMRTGNLS